MKYIAAYLLANLGGNDSPSASDLTSILSSVGIEAEASMVKKVISELSGKDIEDVISQGSSKLASIPSGGASSGAAAGGAGSAAPAAQAAAAPKEEEKEESDEDMGFGLFD